MGGVFHWLQSATSLLDATKSSQLALVIKIQYYNYNSKTLTGAKEFYIMVILLLVK